MPPTKLLSQSSIRQTNNHDSKQISYVHYKIQKNYFVKSKIKYNNADNFIQKKMRTKTKSQLYFLYIYFEQKKNNHKVIILMFKEDESVSSLLQHIYTYIIIISISRKGGKD